MKLNIDNNAVPRFYKAQTIPLALKQKVEAELDNLESMGIISPVHTHFPEWMSSLLVCREATTSPSIPPITT